MTKATKEERAAAMDILKRIGVKPGARLYTKVIHASASGMSRTVDVYIVTKDRRIQWIAGLVARATGMRLDEKRSGIIVGGCGFDAGHEVVYNLGRVMFPNGGPVKKSVRAFQEERAGNKRETDGGYLLIQERL
jgi:hypothetical protein